MTTDLTRSTFAPAKRFSSVRLQQGRMQLDADWNEQIDIALARETTTVGDVVGLAGGPIDAAGFGIAANAAGLDPAEAARPENQPVPALAAGDFLVTGGRYYVAGRLVENARIATYLTQPDLPGAPALAAGVHLVYLEVWERAITALEDPAIREVALGGPDTATRDRRVWQVRTVRVAGPGTAVTCTDPFPEWDALVAPPTGRMAARSEPDPAAGGPCVVPESAGFRSLENQLYRVQVHQGGPRGTATFKWSRENASVAARWLGQNGPTLSVATTGPDRAHGFANGDWVELIDAGRELRGERGTLVRLVDVRPEALVIDPATADGPTAIAGFAASPRIRRWDGQALITPVDGAWHALEQGVQVRFAAGTYRSGDFWTVPARVNTGDVEWPRDGGGQPAFAGPEGLRRHHARLGLVDFDGAGVTATEDCRTLFPPLTELVQLHYVGGDGQEAMPDLTDPAAGAAVPEPLQVAASIGGRPLAGARVAFRVTSGGGAVDGDPAEVEVATGPDGVAAAAWRLGPANAAAPQRVEAVLLDHGGGAVHTPVRFAASFSTASGVAFDPSLCPTLAETRTVQQALEILCQTVSSDEPGFSVERMVWMATNASYVHDGAITLEILARGLALFCDAAVDPDTVLRRPVLFIELRAPSREFGPLLSVMLRLEAELVVEDNRIEWRPGPDLAGVIADVVGPIDGPALCELTLRGDNIRAREPGPDGEPLWLDAEGLEFPGRRILPTGDRRRGGTLVSWFWLGEGRRGLVIDLEARAAGAALRGRVLFDDGSPAEGLSVRLLELRSTRVLAETETRRNGVFAFADAPNRTLVVAAGEGAEEVQVVAPPAAIIRPGRVFRAEDFAFEAVEEAPGLTQSMRDRLRRAGLTDPVAVANADPATLATQLGIVERTAAGLIETMRGLARAPG